MSSRAAAPSGQPGTAGATRQPRYPSLVEINTRAWLHRLSQEAGKPVTLAEVDDAALDDLASQGID
jgi:hypothetical protein